MRASMDKNYSFEDKKLGVMLCKGTMFEKDDDLIYRYKVTFEFDGDKQTFYAYSTPEDYQQKKSILLSEEIDKIVDNIFTTALNFMENRFIGCFMRMNKFDSDDLKTATVYFNECKDTYNKLGLMGMTDTDIYDFIDMIRNLKYANIW